MRHVNYVVVLLLAVACGVGEDSTADTTTATTGGTVTTLGEPTTTGLFTTMALPEGFSAELLMEIIADAADLEGILTSQVEFASVEPMTFDDASLGCPEPGKMYAQVLTPGFIVLVDAGGAVLDYRVAQGSESFRICE